jgi:hypothetical protein
MAGILTTDFPTVSYTHTLFSMQPYALTHWDIINTLTVICGRSSKLLLEHFSTFMAL